MNDLIVYIPLPCHIGNDFLILYRYIRGLISGVLTLASTDIVLYLKIVLLIMAKKKKMKQSIQRTQSLEARGFRGSPLIHQILYSWIRPWTVITASAIVWCDYINIIANISYVFLNSYPMHI